MKTGDIDKPMQQVEAFVHITAPPEEVWAYMADLPFIRDLPFTTIKVVGKPVNVGMMNRLTFALPLGLTFRFDELVTEWVENEHIAYRVQSGWKMDAVAILTPEGRSTRFTFTLRYRRPGLWKLTPRWFMELGWRKGLENLRKMIEPKPTNLTARI